MDSPVPVAVIIPTYRRGTRVFATLEKILACDPIPAEIWIHVDKSDGNLETRVAQQFPFVKILSSLNRLGPGGGRHRCLDQCKLPYAVSFDDDSYPLDDDFFERVFATFGAYPEAAVVGARIWHRKQPVGARGERLMLKPSFTGCGYAIRLSAYRQTRGYVPRAVAYGLEETDLSLQLFSKNWKIYESAELRVFHDTDLDHHQLPEITAGTIANVALFAFLHYPLLHWGWGVLQLANVVWFCARRGRWKGILPGLLRIPWDCYAYRRYRCPLPYKVICDFIKLRRAEQP